MTAASVVEADRAVFRSRTSLGVATKEAATEGGTTSKVTVPRGEEKNVKSGESEGEKDGAAVAARIVDEPNRGKVSLRSAIAASEVSTSSKEKNLEGMQVIDVKIPMEVDAPTSDLVKLGTNDDVLAVDKGGVADAKLHNPHDHFGKEGTEEAAQTCGVSLFDDIEKGAERHTKEHDDTNPPPSSDAKAVQQELLGVLPCEESQNSLKVNANSVDEEGAVVFDGDHDEQPGIIESVQNLEASTRARRKETVDGEAALELISGEAEVSMTNAAMTTDKVTSLASKEDTNSRTIERLSTDIAVESPSMIGASTSSTVEHTEAHDVEAAPLPNDQNDAVETTEVEGVDASTPTIKMTSLTSVEETTSSLEVEDAVFPKEEVIPSSSAVIMAPSTAEKKTPTTEQVMATTASDTAQ